MPTESLLLDLPVHQAPEGNPPRAVSECGAWRPRRGNPIAPNWDPPAGYHDRPQTVDVLHLVHSLTGGGTERTLVALLHRMRSSPIQHAVVTLRAAGPLASRVPDHVAIHALERGKGVSRCGRAIARIARRRGARVLHARNTGCWADAIAAGIRMPAVRLVLGFHGLEHDGPFSRRQRLMILTGKCLGATFTCVSSAGQRLLAEAGAPIGRIRLIRNGVDLNRFAPGSDAAREKLRRAWGWNEHTVGIVAVGSLTPVKGFDILLSAFALATGTCRNLALVIVGDGPLRDSLARQAHEAAIGSRVTLAGAHDDMPAVYAAADLVVCSSRAESLSNALLEATASRKPIISTRVGDHPEVLGDGVAGVLVTPNDVEGFARAMVQLGGDAPERTRLAIAAGDAARRHDFENTVMGYERLYEDCLTGSAKSALVR